MNIVVCTITVLTCHFFSQADVAGKVIATGTTSQTYLVNFSEAAKLRGFDGDYSAVVVAKNKCVELGKTK